MAESPVMKLVCAIVAGGDADKVTESLVSAGYPGPTRINTVGGFLRRGNTTLLLGTDDDRVEGAIDVIRSTVEARPAADDPNARRATIFVLNTSRFIRI
ncbi:MAG: cyclic-di-AMP receptor [Chloroflexota bacterium]